MDRRTVKKYRQNQNKKQAKVKRTYTEKQIVNLYNSGKKASEIIKEYDLTPFYSP